MWLSLTHSLTQTHTQSRYTSTLHNPLGWRVQCPAPVFFSTISLYMYSDSKVLFYSNLFLDIWTGWNMDQMQPSENISRFSFWQSQSCGRSLKPLKHIWSLSSLLCFKSVKFGEMWHVIPNSNTNTLGMWIIPSI